MEKKVFVLGTILLCASLAFSAGPEPLITITAPPNGATLNMCTTYTIHWTHSAYFESVPQTCTIYCGNDVISPPIPVTQDSFVWTVGMKQNGIILQPDQSYEITIESPDYDALNGPVITIIALQLIIKPYPKQVQIIKILDCPMCYKLDPRQFVLKMSGLDFVSIEVVRGRRLLARFGRFTPDGPAPPPAKMTLNEEDVRLIKQRKPAFTVLVKSAKGKILLKKAVQLELKGQTR